MFASQVVYYLSPQLEEVLFLAPPVGDQLEPQLSGGQLLDLEHTLQPSGEILRLCQSILLSGPAEVDGGLGTKIARQL